MAFDATSRNSRLAPTERRKLDWWTNAAATRSLTG